MEMINIDNLKLGSIVKITWRFTWSNNYTDIFKLIQTECGKFTLLEHNINKYHTIKDTANGIFDTIDELKCDLINTDKNIIMEIEVS